MASSERKQLTMDQINALALEQFVYTPVSTEMILYLVDQAKKVIKSEPDEEDADWSQSQQTAESPEDGVIPDLKDFITSLVVCSNVQVPTLMSTLVYLTRLKACLQPKARGRRSTPHRIFMAALILAAKYLNDSSPKNKHWARYTKVHVAMPGVQSTHEFKFHTAEVNEMERQLLFLLNWDLGISEHDLYRELRPFLAPYVSKVKAQVREEDERQARRRKAAEAASGYPSPSPSPPREHTRRPHSGSRSSSSSSSSSSSGRSSRSRSPYTPSLTSSSGTSPASSYGSVSGSTPPPSADAATAAADHHAYAYGGYYPEVVVEADAQIYSRGGRDMLPYEVTAEELRAMHDSQKVGAAGNKGGVRAIFGRVFGGGVAVAPAR